MALEGYPADVKRLASSAQRLRGWVGTDPARAPELADELVRLTAARLAAQAWPDAAPEAQESLALAGRMLASHGPLGPYTPAEAAGRFVVAAVQLADIQAGLGLPEPAGRTVEAARATIAALPQLRLDVDRPTSVRALAVLAAAALDSGDIAAANGYVDAALAAGRPTDDPLLAARVGLLAAACRDAAGRPAEALAWAGAAVEGYRADAGFARGTQLPPARLERLAAPLLPLWRGLAERLRANGEIACGLATGRELVALLEAVLPQVPAAAAWLAAARAALAGDLLDQGRTVEALATARAAAADPDAGEPAHLALGRALLAAGDAEGTLGVLTPLVGRSLAGDSPDPGDAEALRVLAEAVAATGQDATQLREAATQARAAAPVRPAPLDSWPAVTGPLTDGGTADPAALTRDAVRELGARLAATRAGAETTEAALRAAAEAAHDDALAAEREREARRVERERAEAERLRARQEAAARQEAERTAAESEAERRESQRRRQQRIDAHRRESELRALELRATELRAALPQLHDAAEREQAELELLELELRLLEQREQAESGSTELAAGDGDSPHADGPTPVGRTTEEAAGEEGGSRPSLAATGQSAAASAAPEEPPAESPVAEELGSQEPEAPEPAQPSAHTAQHDTAQPDTAGADAGPTGEAEPPAREPETPVDELTALRHERDRALAAGDRRALRSALEALVARLGPIAEQNPGQRPEVLDAWLELAQLRLRAGDWLGSRRAAKETKALATRWQADRP